VAIAAAPIPSGGLVRHADGQPHLYWCRSVNAQWRPTLPTAIGIIFEIIAEARGQHTHNGMRLFVEHDLLADYLWITLVTINPILVSQHNHTLARRLFISGLKAAAQRWPCT